MQAVHVKLFYVYNKLDNCTPSSNAAVISFSFMWQKAYVQRQGVFYLSNHCAWIFSLSQFHS